jgi:hypothetical protein
MTHIWLWSRLDESERTDTHLSLIWRRRKFAASSPARNCRFAAFAFLCPPLLLWHTHLLLRLCQRLLAGVHPFAASMRWIFLSSL